MFHGPVHIADIVVSRTEYFEELNISNCPAAVNCKWCHIVRKEIRRGEITVKKFGLDIKPLTESEIWEKRAAKDRIINIRLGIIGSLFTGSLLFSFFFIDKLISISEGQPYLRELLTYGPNFLFLMLMISMHYLVNPYNEYDQIERHADYAIIERNRQYPEVKKYLDDIKKTGRTYIIRGELYAIRNRGEKGQIT